MAPGEVEVPLVEPDAGGQLALRLPDPVLA